jgi:hypothetical protein
MLRVQPEQLTSGTRALGDVSAVSHALDASRGEITDELGRIGSDTVSSCTEAFLDAWGLGLRGVAERAGWLGSKLHTAASEYQQAEHTLRGHLGAGADGGPA